MLRTQISLSLAEKRLLDAESARTGRSIAALIRDAVDTVYGTASSVDDDVRVIVGSMGGWAGRDEDGAVLVEGLRSGRRLTEGRSGPAEADGR